MHPAELDILAKWLNEEFDCDAYVTNHASHVQHGVGVYAPANGHSGFWLDYDKLEDVNGTRVILPGIEDPKFFDILKHHVSELQSSLYKSERPSAERTCEQKDAELRHSVADRVYNILVRRCWARESGRDDFVTCCTSSDTREYRFCGALGSGGKFYDACSSLSSGKCTLHSDNNWRVDYYSEDESAPRQVMKYEANMALVLLWKSWSEAGFI